MTSRRAAGPVAAVVWRAGLARWDRRGCYGFVHALYQEVLYQRLDGGAARVPAPAVGRRAEAGYGPGQATLPRSWPCILSAGGTSGAQWPICQQAADKALRRYANREADRPPHERAEPAQHAAGNPERMQQELDLLLALGPALMAVKGLALLKWSAPTRGRRIVPAGGRDTQQLCPGVVGLHRFYMLRGELQTSAGVR